MATIDLTALTDAELETLRLDVVQEQIRRHELTTLPTVVDEIIQRFVDHGGDKSKIRDPNSYTKGPKTPRPNAL